MGKKWGGAGVFCLRGRGEACMLLGSGVRPEKGGVRQEHRIPIHPRKKEIP